MTRERLFYILTGGLALSHTLATGIFAYMFFTLTPSFVVWLCAGGGALANGYFASWYLWRLSRGL